MEDRDLMIIPSKPEGSPRPAPCLVHLKQPSLVSRYISSSSLSLFVACNVPFSGVEHSMQSFSPPPSLQYFTALAVPDGCLWMVLAASAAQ